MWDDMIQSDSRLKAVRSDVMFCSIGSEGHLVLFVPLDIGVCHKKKAHLCTDVCYTLTPRPVILSHQPSLDTEKTPQPSRKHPRPVEAPYGPAWACTCQALLFTAALLLVSSPAADSPGILPLWRSLALGQQYSSLGSQPILCGSIPGLVPKQLRFCRNYIEIMPSVAEGVKLGIQECQHQFRGRRWNCTTIKDNLAIFGPVLDK
ncbi:hypothetical protein FQN60_002785, partial [Etheostoma spectabile]